MADGDVRALLRRGALDRLLLRDELAPILSSSDGGGVFAGWREGAITFPPTFKFAKGTHRYVGEPISEGARASLGTLTCRRLVLVRPHTDAAFHSGWHLEVLG